MDAITFNNEISFSILKGRKERVTHEKSSCPCVSLDELRDAVFYAGTRLSG